MDAASQFDGARRIICLALFIFVLLALPNASFAQTWSGSQVIDGTEVYTEIFQSQGYARFRNSCGTQTITQRELQAGAKPTNIIPCPRPRGSTPPSYNPPKSDNRKRCGDGYCPANTICTKEQKCLPKASNRVCPNGQYCDAQYICTDENRCLPVDSPRYCGGRSVCPAGHFCTTDKKCRSVDSPTYCGVGSKHCEHGTFCDSDLMKCVPVDAPRFCGDGKWCSEGQVCDRDKPAGSKRCSGAAASSDEEEKESKFVALVSTNTGRFFGVGIAASQSQALSEAKALCEAQKANTATTPEEREELCDFDVWVENGCVALARSHDMYYGPSEEFAAGLSTDETAAGASSEANGSCKQKGGQNCFIVPESVRCHQSDME